MIITRNSEYHEWQGSSDEFSSSSLPIKGWSIYGGEWPLPRPAQPLWVPQIISMRQCQLYLYDMGALSDVEQIVQGMTPKAIIEWNKSSEVWRSSPLVEQMRVAFGWTTDQMDQMFIDAGGL